MMTLVPIGTVRKTEKGNFIDLEERFSEGLLGLDGFSHVIVAYWLHENDTEERRETLRVHPRHDEANPLTGVFATHSPLRPNPIAITVCELHGIEGCRLSIGDIDAFDGSPVVDIKCYIDWAMPRNGIRLPDWV